MHNANLVRFRSNTLTQTKKKKKKKIIQGTHNTFIQAKQVSFHSWTDQNYGVWWTVFGLEYV